MGGAPRAVTHRHSVIYGIAGLVDVATFYPAGKVMDTYGRGWSRSRARS